MSFDYVLVELDALEKEHAVAIKRLVARYQRNPDFSEVLDDFCHDLKCYLGAELANKGSDADSEKAVDLASEWVTNHVSNNSFERRLAAVAYLGELPGLLEDYPV